MYFEQFVFTIQQWCYIYGQLKLTARWGYLMASWPSFHLASNLALAIACKFMCYGCVNWSDENFPFKDAVYIKKMVTWRKEKNHDKND